jgi:hypothetical protein
MTCLKLVCLGNRAVGGVIEVLFKPKGMSLGQDCSTSRDPSFTEGRAALE